MTTMYADRYMLEQTQDNRTSYTKRKLSTVKTDVNNDCVIAQFELFSEVIVSNIALVESQRSSVPATDTVLRLLDFVTLEDNWDGDASPAPSCNSITMANRFLVDVKGLESLASVYPCTDGGVLLEWTVNDWGYSLRTLNDETIAFFGVEITGDGEIGDIEVPFSDYETIIDAIEGTLPQTQGGSTWGEFLKMMKRIFTDKFRQIIS
ncbi:MAG: hypothetical protein OXG25_06620 [Gammaproteobacteria bacterium]|nr:hypothetical protein [Gammaproteobacteria bacterium]